MLKARVQLVGVGVGGRVALDLAVRRRVHARLPVDLPLDEVVLGARDVVEEQDLVVVGDVGAAPVFLRAQMRRVACGIALTTADAETLQLHTPHANRVRVAEHRRRAIPVQMAP